VTNPPTMNVATRMIFCRNSMRSDVRKGRGSSKMAKSVRTFIGVDER
jgi:hypothetical protein